MTLRLPKVTEELLDQWYERDQKRRKLEQEARQLAKENELVVDDIEAAMVLAGKKELARGLYRLVFQQKPGSPRWKEEFIRVAGAGAAADIAAAMPKVDKLSISKVSDADSEA